MFQYASELFFPISEIIPTGYLFTIGNIGGVIMVALMGWSENLNEHFSMKIPTLCLTLTMVLSVYYMYKVKGELKRTLYQRTHLL